MGLVDGQVPEYGHTKEIPEGIEGLEVSQGSPFLLVSCRS